MAVNIGPKIGIEGEREYRKAINDLITQQKTFSAEMRELESSFDDNTSAMEKNRKKSELLTKQIENQEKQVEELEKGLEAAKDTYGDNATETQKWKQAVSNAKTELNKMRTELKQIPSGMSQVGQSMQDVGKKMQDIGSGLTKHVTAPLAAIGAASVAAWHEVDEGMDIVVKKTGVTGEALESLQDTAKSIATTIPTSFETAGEAVGEVYTRFGLTGESLEDLSTKFIKFAELNDTDVSSSIDNVQKLMEAYGLSTEEAGDLLDALNKTGQDTGISMDALESSMLKNATALKDMGLDAYDAAAFLGQVETSGIETSTVMAGLSKALTNASKEGKTLPEALKDFQNVMQSSASDQEKLTAATELFGKKAGPAIYDACKTGSLSFEDLSKNASDYLGSVNATFENTLDPVDNFKTALNKAKEAGSEVGGTLLEIAAPAVEDLGEMARSAGKWFKGLKGDQQKLVAYAGVFAAGMGPAMSILGNLTEAAGSAIEALGNIKGSTSILSSLASPAGIALLGLGALSAALISAREEGIASNEALQEMLGNTSGATEALENATTSLEDTVKRANESLESIDAQAGSAQALVAELYALERQSNKTAVEQKRMELIVNELNSMYPELGLQIDSATGKLNKGEEAVSKYIDSAKDLALLEAYGKAAQETLEKLAQTSIEHEKALKAQAEGYDYLEKARTALTEAENAAPKDYKGQVIQTKTTIDAANALKLAEQEQVKLNQAVTDSEAAMKDAEEEYNMYTESQETLKAKLSDTTEEQENQNEATEKGTEKAKKYSEALKENVKSMLDVGKNTASIVSDTQKQITAWDELYKATYDSISGQIGLFDEWNQEIELTAQDMLKNLQSQTEAYSNYATNMETLSRMAMESSDPNFKALVKSIADMGMDGAGYLQELVRAAEEDKDLFNDLIAEYGNTEQAKKNAARVTTDVKNEYTSKAKIITKGFNKIVSEVGNSKVFKQLRTNMQNSVKEAQKKTSQWQATTKSSVTQVTSSLTSAVKTGFATLVSTASASTTTTVRNTQDRINRMTLKPSVSSITVAAKVTDLARNTIQKGSSGAKPQVGQIVVPGKRLSTAKGSIVTGTSGGKPTLGMIIVPGKNTSAAKTTIQKGTSGAKPSISSITVTANAKSAAKSGIQKGTSGAKPSISSIKVEDKAKSDAKYNIETSLVGINGSVGTISGGATAGWNARVDAAGQLTEIGGSVGTLSGAADAGKNAHTTAQNNFGTVTGSVKLSGAKEAAQNAVATIKRNIPTVYVPVAARTSSATRPYAEGGFITEEQVAMVGEQNKPEVIIPLSASKRSRAIDLYQETGEILGLDTATSLSRTTKASLPGRREGGNSSVAGGGGAIIDIDKIYSAVAAGAARGMEKANVKIYANNREVGRILRNMGVQFA